ncbi:hypothetical protein D9M72_504570 [compost metagenome]
MRVLLAEQVEDAPAFLREVGARRARVVEVVQRQRAAAREQHVGAAQPLAGPLAGRDDFGRSHAAVAVGVDEVERARIEVDAARGAGECDPQFLVELGDACDVLAAAEHHLIHAAGTDELPAVRRRAWRVGAGKAGGNGGGGGRQRVDVLGRVVRDQECLKRAACVMHDAAPSIRGRQPRSRGAAVMRTDGAQRCRSTPTLRPMTASSHPRPTGSMPGY